MEVKEEIMDLLDGWRNLPNPDSIILKDYFKENDSVYLSVAVSIEKAFLFKTFTAKCPLNKQSIEKAICKLEEKKDDLI